MEDSNSRKVVEAKRRGIFQKTYCVTGATGYVGSWLVRTLNCPGSCDRLRLFQADLNEEGSFNEAVKCCDGVFHAAASMDFGVDLEENTGDPELFGILSAVNGRMGSIALVNIEDICRAHMFLMEHDKSKGRYICRAQSYPLSKKLNYLAQEYPSSNLQRFLGEDLNQSPV